MHNAEAIRVLIVDDDANHAQLVTEFLRLSGHYAVTVAPALHQMWLRLANDDYDVALLDYNLPDGNGLDALPEIARRGHHLPVVMVTGRGDERVAAQAIQRGAVDYLVKGGDYLRMLPPLVDKAVRTHQLLQSAQRSLEQIRYQAFLLDNVRDAVVVWDLAGRLTFWNHAAERLFGWTADETVGRPVEVYLSAFEPAVELPSLGATLLDVERRFCAAERELWVSSTLTPLNHGQGLAGYMDVARDITARKQLEAQVRAAHFRLAEASRLTAIGELASGIAHQINNPLTTIIAEAQLLQRESPGANGWRDSISAIEQAGWRAQHSVQRLMEFSRPAIKTLEPVSVNATIQHAVMLVGAQLESQNVRVCVELADNLPPVFGSARQLEDLWVNLLLQARDATADGEPHAVRLHSRLNSDGAVRVTVTDDGEVIPPEQLPYIFEPDFAGFSRRRGAGLGLSLCREIVRQHHGQLSVDSTPQLGTTFTITLSVEERA
jgi:PAS domain S-box-containing protein